MGGENKNIGKYKRYLRLLEKMKKGAHSEQSSKDCDSEESFYDEEIILYEGLLNKSKAKKDVQFYLEFKKFYLKDNGLNNKTKKNIIELVLAEAANNPPMNCSPQNSGTLKAGDVFLEGADTTDCGSCVDGEFCYEDDNLQGLDEYQTEKRGTFFIFTFTDDRAGVTCDCENYKKIAKMLGFEKIIVYEDRNKKEIKEILTEYGEKGHRGDDCVVCAIAAHGSSKDLIHVGMGETLNLNGFVKYFSEDKCKGLKGKPKFIIVQACRGMKFDYANQDCKGIDCTEETSSNYNDLLLASSSIPDTKSMRNTTDGSYYIQYLLDEIEKNCGQHKEICEILTNVNRQLSKTTFDVNGGNNVKQMSCFRSNLTKKLYFKKVNRDYDVIIAEMYTGRLLNNAKEKMKKTNELMIRPFLKYDVTLFEAENFEK